MHRIEQTRVFSGSDPILGVWLLPPQELPPPYAAVLFFVDADAALNGAWATELALESARQGVALWRGLGVHWSPQHVQAAWDAAGTHPLISRARVGVMAAGAASAALRAAESGLVAPRPPQFSLHLEPGALLPDPSAQSAALEERRSAVALAAHTRSLLLPTWERAARRPGTAIG